MTTPTEQTANTEAPTIETPVVETPVTTETPANTDPVTLDDGTQTAQEAAPEATQEGTEFRYSETGDAALDVALTFFGKLGLGPQDPAILAASNGKFELLEAKMAVAGDKAVGWEQHVALAKDAFGRATDAQTARTNEIASVVTKVATDSNVSWTEVQKWASLNADPDEKQAINAMLTADKVQARAAANMLVEAYRNAGGTTIEPKSAVNSAANGGQTNTNNGALSPREYSAAVAALSAKIGSHAVDSSPEYAALQRRRLAYAG